MTTEKDSKLIALNALEGNSVQAMDPINGWMDVDRQQISYKGVLYPEKYRFQVKAAEAGTIKYFSTLDEKNPQSVNDALTYIVKNHVRVLDGARQIDSLDVIYEHDRFFFVMLVHAYSGAPTSLSYATKCAISKCNTAQDVSITAYNIQYTELSDKALGYLNTKTGRFMINTKTMGERQYKPLSLNEASELSDWVRSARQEGQDIEQFFITAAPFLMHNRKEKDTAKDIYQQYLRLTSDTKEISLLTEIVKTIDVRQVLETSNECTKCKQPFRSQISSIAGISDIFLVHDIASELS